MTKFFEKQTFSPEDMGGRMEGAQLAAQTKIQAIVQLREQARLTMPSCAAMKVDLTEIEVRDGIPSSKEELMSMERDAHLSAELEDSGEALETVDSMKWPRFRFWSGLCRGSTR